MGLLTDNQGWHETDLVLWLDRQIPHPDIPLRDAQAFITRVLRRLQSERGVSLQRLIHDKYRLRPAIAQRIDQHRRAVQEEGYQQMLLDDSPLEVTPDLIFTFDPHAYPINRRYQGSYEFHKHYYPEVGHFDTQEEFECAQMLDALAQMDVWVRNPARSAKAFWLQTATAKFYPDFVCRLRDGRYLVVEYKGEIYRTNDDSEEKNTIGELWERRSGGSCLFLMVSGRNYEAIRNKVSNPTW
jgi:type III restriction enzyme